MALHLLPLEIREQIFANLDQCDLLNVLSTGSLWAEAVVPALWSNLWIDTLSIVGMRNATDITSKEAGDTGLPQPVSFVHEKKRRYMVVGKSRLRAFCIELRDGRYRYALSCVKTLNISIEYTLPPAAVIGVLEDCDDLSLVHWLLEEIPQYFTSLTTLEVLTESVVESGELAVSKLDFENAATNVFLTIEHPRISLFGPMKFTNVKVLRLEITFQERIYYDLDKHFKAKLPESVERFDLVNYAQSSLTVAGLLRFIENCRRLRSLTVFSSLYGKDGNSSTSELEFPELQLIQVNSNAAKLLDYILFPHLEQLSVDNSSGHGISPDSMHSLLQKCFSIKQLELIGIPLSIASQIISSATSIQVLVISASAMEVFTSEPSFISAIEALQLSTLILSYNTKTALNVDSLHISTDTQVVIQASELPTTSQTRKIKSYDEDYITDIHFGSIRLIKFSRDSGTVAYILAPV